jgi:hypothetical protein
VIANDSLVWLTQVSQILLWTFSVRKKTRGFLLKPVS